MAITKLIQIPAVTVLIQIVSADNSPYLRSLFYVVCVVCEMLTKGFHEK